MTTIKNIIWITIIALPSVALAQFTELENKFSQYYMDLIVPVGVVLAAIMIVYSGILYTTSQGDPAKTTLAKEFLFGAIIGLIILLSAGWIVDAIVSQK